MVRIIVLVPVFAALGLASLLSAASAVAGGGTPPRYDDATCTNLRLEQMKYVQAGVVADFQRGAEWAKVNATAARMREIEQYIRLDEDVKFGCRDAVLSADAVSVRDAAKRLEIDPNSDPTAPLPPAGGQQNSGDGAAAGAKPRATVGGGSASQPKKNPAKPANQAEADRDGSGLVVPRIKRDDPNRDGAKRRDDAKRFDDAKRVDPPKAASSTVDSKAPSGDPPSRRWVPIGDANLGVQP